MKREEHTSSRWGALCALASGAGWLIPVVFYFFLLPAAGSGPTHAQDAADFLPWMVEHGTLRVALWWTTALPLVIALLGVPLALRERLKGGGRYATSVATLAGILGLFTLLVAALVLAVGETPLAAAYRNADAAARPGIVASYEWQRLATAILFDVLGLFLMGVWILLSSIAGARVGGLPKGASLFGVATALLCFLFVSGYVTDVGWLGEGGIGMLSFLAIPAWMIWMGSALLHEPPGGAWSRG